METQSITRSSVKRKTFDRSGFYFIGLLIIAFLGFWRSYFSRFFYGGNGQSFYFHFHAVMMLTWTAMLIVQPILIRKKKLQVHRFIGKLSYVIMPLLLISVLLVLNFSLKQVPAEEIHFPDVLFPVRDFFFLSIFYTVAVINRHKVQIHARAMVATGIVFIEPSLARFLGRHVFHGPAGAITTWAFILVLLIVLIILDWKQKSGRWIFRSMLVVFIISYAIVISSSISGFQIPLLDSAIQWFAKLPLT
jgi:hypothetical protein